ncbi:preprotein translocase subunit SecG [Buchnera aphidicola]|uniref:preprotein translocase subunit SecG n=1 Tax=Buchnera aphidicola TaxID=9 RepID=UPI00094C016C|nr:preprotein translocase subunit SecG [Buchnera aphidicola]
MHLFLLIVLLFVSVALVSIIIFQPSPGNELSSTTSDYSSQLFTEGSKNTASIYIIFFLLMLFLIINLLLSNFKSLMNFYSGV